IREGAKRAIKETYTAADGSFSAKIPAGRYSLRAIAQGFSEVLFESVQVSPSAEIAYRFNLEPANSPRTLVNQRSDKDNVKWILRSTQSRRSIFQANEGDDPNIAAVERASNSDPEAEQTNTDERGRVRLQGVAETYFASSSNPFSSPYEGVNFAVALPVSETIDLIFAGQTGVGVDAPQRFETTARLRLDDRHRVSLSGGGNTVFTVTGGKSPARNRLGQVSVRAIDEWLVRDGVVIVLGLDYSRFTGAGGAAAITPRFGVQFDANARTRLTASYAPGGDEGTVQSTVNLEDGPVMFKQPMTQPVAFVGGRAVMGQSRRLEFGVQRVLSNRSNVEATAFLDMTEGRGVGLMALPLSGFSGEPSLALANVANQNGSARGMRVVYSHRLNHVWSASAGYSFGRGQKLSPQGISNPGDLFSNAFFQTAAVQVAGDWSTGTHVQTVFRFSPQATVFAIDPFAGRLAVYDPSLSIEVTQDLPTFGLPIRAQAVIDARNLFDFQSRTNNGETMLETGTYARSVRGGILFRF
ncbi:MAG TPA: carboxypeptidase-like regulatory domain-containing protein, partial [Terriglobia bacterium]|nr:carboxypeptidase-like regulatory domain-containing protein [Terriglobia bacterium]